MSRQDFLSILEAAEEFGVSRLKLHRWIKDGRLRFYRTDSDLRKRLVLRADVEALVAPVLGVPEVKSAA